VSLADIVRKGIAIANDITEKGDIQKPVTYEAWTGQSGTGAPTYATGASIPAIVEYEVNNIYDRAGQVIPVQAKVTFLRPIAANGATDREEPLDPRDRITLPNGSTGPIVKVGGLIDGGTGNPYMLTVWIGR
jgi:hypothetical protein